MANNTAPSSQWRGSGGVAPGVTIAYLTTGPDGLRRFTDNPAETDAWLAKGVDGLWRMVDANPGSSGGVLVKQGETFVILG